MIPVPIFDYHRWAITNNEAISKTDDVLNYHALSNEALVLRDTAHEAAVKSKIDQIEETYSKMVNFFSEEEGYTESARRFSLWRQGDTSNLPLDTEWLRNTKTISNAEKRNEIRFASNPQNEVNGMSIYKFSQGLKDGETKQYEDLWMRKFGPLGEFASGDKDLAAVVGNNQLVSKGRFDVSRQGNIYSIKGHVQHKVEPCCKPTIFSLWPPTKEKNKEEIDKNVQ